MNVKQVKIEKKTLQKESKDNVTIYVSAVIFKKIKNTEGENKEPLNIL